MKPLGLFIRELREKKDISLRELAKKLDISAAYLSDVELSRRNPSDEFLEKVVPILGVSIQELKKHDVSAPIKELRTLSSSNPRYGFAFRSLVDVGATPDDIERFVEELKKKDKKK